MTWDRRPVAAALVDILSTATGVTVHPKQVDTLNPMCMVVNRVQLVNNGTPAFGIDEATLPVTVIGGLESEDDIEDLKVMCRKAVDADQTLGGVVQVAYFSQERNWRNITGAGGIQLVMCELVLTIQM